jgi:putative FmdB family regulatory protein
MPIYEYRCAACGATQDAFARIDDRDTSAPHCCGQATARMLSAPMVSVPQNCEYKCPVTDQIVTSYRQRRNIMAEHNLRDANDLKPSYVIEQTKKKTAARQALAAQLPGLPPGVTAEQVFAAA